MNKITVLKSTSFGERVAEEESDKLKNYFVTTDIWNKVYNGAVDVIYGSKGSGKSAIYSTLEEEVQSLSNRKIWIKSAENPRGNTVFQGLVATPPTSELEFVMLWKLYFLSISTNVLNEKNVEGDGINKLNKILEDSGLKPPRSSLKSILMTCMQYVQRLTKLDSIQPGVDLNEVTGLPSGISLKISFREPSISEHSAGIVPIDELFDVLNSSLETNKSTLWILIDRLDVAFLEDTELETNALRALFIAYNDLKPYYNIRLKIFLRDDIWRRITKEGFREASHITKTATIIWTKETLLNLAISRALTNQNLTDFYDVKADEVIKEYSLQEEFFYKMFPEQVDPGSKRPKTLDWILTRIKDGLGVMTPREMIHLLNECVSEQINMLSIGEDGSEGNRLISSGTLKKALDKVSKVRLEQTIYAEYPKLQQSIMLLEGEKAEQTLTTLSIIWKVQVQEANKIALDLVNIGLFEPRGTKAEPRYWIPFLYRSALNIVQGSADN